MFDDCVWCRIALAAAPSAARLSVTHRRALVCRKVWFGYRVHVLHRFAHVLHLFSDCLVHTVSCSFWLLKLSAWPAASGCTISRNHLQHARVSLPRMMPSHHSYTKPDGCLLSESHSSGCARDADDLWYYIRQYVVAARSYRAGALVPQAGRGIDRGRGGGSCVQGGAIGPKHTLAMRLAMERLADNAEALVCLRYIFAKSTFLEAYIYKLYDLVFRLGANEMAAVINKLQAAVRSADSVADINFVASPFLHCLR